MTVTDGVTTKELHVPQLEVYGNDLTGEVYGTTDLPSVEGSFSLFAFP